MFLLILDVMKNHSILTSYHKSQKKVVVYLLEFRSGIFLKYLVNKKCWQVYVILVKGIWRIIQLHKFLYCIFDDVKQRSKNQSETIVSGIIYQTITLRIESAGDEVSSFLNKANKRHVNSSLVTLDPWKLWPKNIISDKLRVMMLLSLRVCSNDLKKLNASSYVNLCWHSKDGIIAKDVRWNLTNIRDLQHVAE